MPEGEWSIGAMNMFHNIPHHTYQNNPIEIVYVNREQR
jgi:hypothetical protein